MHVVDGIKPGSHRHALILEMLVETDIKVNLN